MALAATPTSLLIVFFFSLLLTMTTAFSEAAAASTTTKTWCIAKKEASTEALQTALDYACSSGADCAPLKPDGPCHLPNTIQAHASYAFNSYFHRNNACHFSGTAAISITDPSYGTCVFPSSTKKIKDDGKPSMRSVVIILIVLAVVVLGISAAAEIAERRSKRKLKRK